MLSMETNLLLYAFNEASPWHKQAYGWMSSIQHDEDVAVSELILAEFYGLLSNPAVLKRPLGAAEAVAVVQAYQPPPALAFARLHAREPFPARCPVGDGGRQNVRFPSCL
jgi:predicted nucleic acid-binding protein